MHAADEMIHLRTHAAADLGKAVGGHVLRPHQPHRHLHQCLGDLAHVLRPPQKIGGGPHQEYGHEQGDDHHGQGGQVLVAERIFHGHQCWGIERGDGKHPQKGCDKGRPEGGRGRPPPQPLDDGRSHGIIGVRRARPWQTVRRRPLLGRCLLRRGIRPLGLGSFPFHSVVRSLPVTPCHAQCPVS